MRLFNAIRPNTGIYLSLSSCPNLPLVYLIVGSFFPSQNFSRSCFIKQLDYPRARGKVAWSSRKELSETVATVKKLLIRIRRVVVLANQARSLDFVEGAAPFGYLGLVPHSLGGDPRNNPPFFLLTTTIIKAFGSHLDFATWCLTHTMNRKSVSSP